MSAFRQGLDTRRISPQGCLHGWEFDPYHARFADLVGVRKALPGFVKPAGRGHVRCSILATLTRGAFGHAALIKRCRAPPVPTSDLPHRRDRG